MKPPEPSAVVASIPAGILRREDISATAKILFGCIWSLLGAHERCFISNRTLAERMGLKNPDSIRHLITQLQKAGLIKRVMDETHHRVGITVVWKLGEVVVERKRTKGSPPRIGGSPPPDRRIRGPGPTDPGPTPFRADQRALTSSAAREDAAAALAIDLLRRGEELGLKGFSEAKLDDAIQTFNAEAVARALDQAEKHGAESWGYCLTMLRRWRAEGELPQPQHKARRNGKPQPAPPSIVYQPPAEDTPLEPGKALAMVAEMKRQLARKEAKP